MKLLLLVTNNHNQTAVNLIDALIKIGHEIDVIPYFQNGCCQCTLTQTPESSALVYQQKRYYPSSYDGVLLWCWVLLS